MRTERELLLAKIQFVIDELILGGNYSNQRASNHFVHLRNRVIKGQKLTKKMQENLAWIQKSVVLTEGIRP